MKPFFLRAVVNKRKFKGFKTEDSKANSDAGQEEKDVEIVGGDNCTPRDAEAPPVIINNSGFVCDPTPYRKHTYAGTDPFVTAKLTNTSQGLAGIRKANSMVRLRRGEEAEGVINKPGMIRSSYGKNFRVKNNYMGGQQSQGYWNQYDPDCEPNLAPERDFEDEAAYFFFAKNSEFRLQAVRKRWVILGICGGPEPSLGKIFKTRLMGISQSGHLN
jgi:hypothetical protein